MAWIRVIDEFEATGALQTLYHDLAKRRGKVANIMKIQSLNPGSIETHLALYLHLLFGPSPLSRGEREIIAVAVSAANGCQYCLHHHTEALSHYEKDARLLKALGEQNCNAVPPRLRLMLDYAVKLTRTPTTMSERDVQSLRDGGFSDEQILNVALISAYFNFVNRTALGLGVEFGAEEVKGYGV
jgi:uncharacterized peroxidase-related enzyme